MTTDFQDDAISGMGMKPKFQARVRKKADRQDIDKAMAIAVIERDKMAKEAAIVEREKVSPANNDRFTSLLKSYYSGKKTGMGYKELELVVAELRRMYRASEEMGKWSLSAHNKNLVRKDGSFLGDWKPSGSDENAQVKERSNESADLAIRDQEIPAVTFATVEEVGESGEVEGADESE